MNQVTLLHTVARRFLMDASAHWSARYAETGSPWSGKYSTQDLDTFPRYQILDAILEEVERLRPDDYSSFELLRERLTEAGSNAHSIFTAGLSGEVERLAMAEERAHFTSFIAGLTPADVAEVQPLAYRRVLSDHEVEGISSRLHEAWGAEPGHWFPQDSAAREDILEFHAPEFRREFGAFRLQRVLAAHGVDHLWELREYGASYEMEISQLDPEYTGAEGFWFSAQFDWIVFASHESSVTLGGMWLLSEIKRTWPEWQQWLWSPDS